MTTTPSAAGAAGERPPAGVLHLRTWLPAELDETFSVWCDDHHAEQLVVPGFLRVRRFSLVDSSAAEPADYLTIYDLADLYVLDGPDYAAYRAKGNTVPEALQGRLRAARTDAREVAGRPTVDGLVPGGAGLAHLFVADGPDLGPWFAEQGPALLDAWSRWGATHARLLRSATGEQAVLVELAIEPGHEPTTAPLPPGLADDAGWGRYRLDHVNTPAGGPASPHRPRHARP